MCDTHSNAPETVAQGFYRNRGEDCKETVASTLPEGLDVLVRRLRARESQKSCELLELRAALAAQDRTRDRSHASQLSVQDHATKDF